MKFRLTAVLLLAIMLFSVLNLSSCGEIEGDGAIFNAYVASETFCFDPLYASTDDNTAQYLSLIFEGMTKIDAKGKLKYALLDHYKYTQDKIRNEYKLTLYMKHTKWSDAASVTADDFLFAWKRLLSPDYSGTAASLLYDIKNARAAKESECSIDDVGIASVDTYTLELTFEYDIDVDIFLRTCASIHLVPLRENVIMRSDLAMKNWARRYSTLSCNGPFCVRGLDYANNTVTLQRNNFYYKTDDDAINEYVEPYKIVINFVKNSADGSDGQGENLQAQLDKYLSGEILYLGDLPLAKRSEYASKGHVTNNLSTMSLLVNCNNDLLKNASVRKALSLAIDRNDLASTVVFAKPATGLINELVAGSSAKSSFRSENGSIISTSADVAAAKSLLSGAGVKDASITLTYKNSEEFAAVANKLKSSWESIGLTVYLKPVLSDSYVDVMDEQELTFYNDTLQKLVQSAEYDILLCDFSMISVNPFGVLAQFAFGFTGNACDMENDWALLPHISGYNSEAYNDIIEKAFAEKKYSERTKILYDAEKTLVEEAPIIPLLFNQNFCMYSNELSKITIDYFGHTQLTKVLYKNYVEAVEE